MSILPLVMCAAMFMMMNKNKGNTSPPSDLFGIFSNPNAMSALGLVGKLMDDREPQENKTSVIFELLSNPFVGELLSKLFPQPATQECTEGDPRQDTPNDPPSGGKKNAESKNDQDGPLHKNKESAAPTDNGKTAHRSENTCAHNGGLDKGEQANMSIKTTSAAAQTKSTPESDLEDIFPEPIKQIVLNAMK